ncbi:sorbosone dehydrogenase family protein [Egicoccus sp. AB-alg2]|uniref:PQQ-dependent sugar dehydrogenase n=1 Tax=Egicoccus sp. AB-alg2 TaxID=3242693 RepID=UPI00359E67B7
MTAAVLVLGCGTAATEADGPEPTPTAMAPAPREDTVTDDTATDPPPPPDDAGTTDDGAADADDGAAGPNDDAEALEDPADAPDPRPLPDDFDVEVESLAAGLDPLTFAGAPPGDERIFLLTQDGQVLLLVDGEVLSRPFLDLRDEVVVGTEQGLLGLAFHPEDPDRFVVHYSARPDGDTRVVQYRADPNDPDRADPGSARDILTLEQPHHWHNGGMVAFDREGLLWLGLGDGGPGEDPAGRGQDPTDLLGSLVRIDPDPDGDEPYAVPADNPFANGDAGAPEVWAYGLRNPWRFWLDPVDDTVTIGDVGQYRYEEIDVLGVDEAGANLGWAVREGPDCFGADTCDEDGLVDPVVTYAHDGQACAVVAGPVYRGRALPELWGHHLYTDVCAGWLRTFLLDDGELADEGDLTDRTGTLRSPVSLGVDGDGEVLVATGTGEVLRLVPAG